VALDGYPPAAVCDWAAEADVDLVVAAAHRGLVQRMLLGSFAAYLAHHSPCTILLVRPVTASARA
jgi:nucleotide-binding universal stress UspA family protein